MFGRSIHAYYFLVTGVYLLDFLIYLFLFIISFIPTSKHFQGIGPSHILAMTFTTAAAAEMRDRIGAVAGKATAKELMISTFHSFSLQLCRSHAEKYAYIESLILDSHELGHYYTFVVIFFQLNHHN